ncbi:helix-turn-helix domain-containing protein [Gorillibacterium massiliense]|uniref:helix-turn-helix domain-containing protein n=1 Tax=Gorillibacterium massiliense TaxID=1280390 RepID=UPI0005946AFA|nr:transcriptional regulator [Gorillibacterium massiliense]
MPFYDVLKDLRKEKGYTIREVSGRSGVSPAYISQLENGQRGIPSPDVLMKLSEGLNTSYSELMRHAGYLEQVESSLDKPSAPINLRRFLRDNEVALDGVPLTAEDKEWVERMLTALFWKERRRTDRE